MNVVLVAAVALAVFGVCFAEELPAPVRDQSDHKTRAGAALPDDPARPACPERGVPGQALPRSTAGHVAAPAADQAGAGARGGRAPAPVTPGRPRVSPVRAGRPGHSDREDLS